MRQLLSCDALQFSEEDYGRLIASKTASLMSASCEMGAVAGEPAYRAQLAAYGHALGMAFQIADDLLDYTETADVTGKPAGQDLREHKVTLPLIAALLEMGPAATAEIEGFFEDPEPSDDGIARVIELVVAHGGIEYARTKANHFGELAHAALLGLPDSSATEALRDAVFYVIDRRN